MNQVGSVSLIASLAFAVYALVAGAVGGKLRSPRITRSAERAALGFFLMVTLAVVALEYMILTNDFHNAYVAEHSNRDLLTYYKVAALWAGQEGSLLFWTWLLSIYSALVVWQNRRKNRQLMPYVVSVLMGVGTFFSLLVFFVANPFQELSMVSAAGTQAFTAPDGNGLNPLLQYHSMVIHPPMLYLGYVGMVVPFAFAMAALITRQLGDNWIRITRRWTMVPWMLLGFGILLGGNWAYAVLGWGGYWGWDPVENASLLPWLSGTAFLHSVMIQEKRGMLKVWNVVAGHPDVLPEHLRHFPDAQRDCFFRPRFRAIQHRPVLCRFPRHHSVLFGHLAIPAPRSFEKRKQARFHGLARKWVPVQ